MNTDFIYVYLALLWSYSSFQMFNLLTHFRWIHIFVFHWFHFIFRTSVYFIPLLLIFWSVLLFFIAKKSRAEPKGPDELIAFTESFISNPSFVNWLKSSILDFGSAACLCFGKISFFESLLPPLNLATYLWIRLTDRWNRGQGLLLPKLEW